MSSTASESDLIGRAISGDQPSLELLLHRHRKNLTNFVKTFLPGELRGRLEVMDVVQDVWLKAFRSIAAFRPTSSESFGGWLVTIARNVMADQVRFHATAKRGGNRRNDLPDENDSMVNLLEDLALYHRTPSKSAAGHELLVVLENAISRLPDDQAQAIKLRHLSGLTFKEIASQMGRSEESIWMLCNRGLKSLRWEMRSVSLYI